MAGLTKVFAVALIIVHSSIVSAKEWVKYEGGAISVELNPNQLEPMLWKYLSTKSEYKFQNKESYVFQYYSNDKNIININGMCRIIKGFNLKKNLYVVMDGGSCYFQLKYKVRTNEYYELSVNGEA